MKKRYYVMAVLTALALLLAFSLIYSVWDVKPMEGVLKVGFLYRDDEAVADTSNFALAQAALESAFGGRVETLATSNVPANGMEDPVREMIKKGCGILFTNSNSDQLAGLAREYPNVQFCQVSYSEGKAAQDRPANYHTFNGRLYEARYVSGVAAGIKLQSMIENGELEKESVQIGFVCDFANSEALSDAAAFLLGIRSVVPDAVMRIKPANKWSSYRHEMACAAQLIQEGCVVIGQHSHTNGPAVACEAAIAETRVIHVGCHQSMLDLAPTTSLMSVRVNWAQYVTEAVSAVLNNKPIESVVRGTRYGDSDISGGFDYGWVELLELNHRLATDGMEARLSKLIEGFRKGTVDVFRGDYTGVDPLNASRTVDLRLGFKENESSSSPAFRYLLEGVMTLE